MDFFYISRGTSRNSTFNGLELYRSLQRQSQLQGRSNPRWLEYSIHHVRNQITSIPVPRNVPPTLATPNSNYASDNEENELSNETNDDIYYYNDVDPNLELLRRDSTDIASIDNTDMYSLPYHTTSLPSKPPKLEESTFPVSESVNFISHVPRAMNTYNLRGERITVRLETQNTESSSAGSSTGSLLRTTTVASSQYSTNTLSTNGKMLKMAHVSI